MEQPASEFDLIFELKDWDSQRRVVASRPLGLSFTLRAQLAREVMPNSLMPSLLLALGAAFAASGAPAFVGRYPRGLISCRPHQPYAQGDDTDETLQPQIFNQSNKRRTKDDWIDGRQMNVILSRREEERRRNEQGIIGQLPGAALQEKPRQPRSQLSSFDTSSFVSAISYTDADTLTVNIPPSGIGSRALSSGAFSALWFSAIAPATRSMLATGAGIAPVLFMAPFWLAGGLLAKNAFYDPFISSSEALVVM